MEPLANVVTKVTTPSATPGTTNNGGAANNNNNSTGFNLKSWLQQRAHGANFKIGGFSDDNTISNLKAGQVTQPAPANPAVSQNGGPVNQQVQPGVAPTNDSNSVATVSARSERIEPYYSANASFIGQDASQLHVDAQSVEVAVSAFGAALITTGQWIKRIGNTGYQLNFDATGTSLLGPLVNFSMQAWAPGGTTTLPVLGFLLRITAYQGSLGQNAFVSFAGSTNLTLPKFQYSKMMPQKRRTS